LGGTVKNQKLIFLILKSKSICYDSTMYFADITADILENQGFQVDICCLSNHYLDTNLPSEAYEELEQFIGKTYTAILDFNSCLPKLHTASGGYYLDLINAPFYDYILDHPLYHHDSLVNELSNFHVICLDTDHLNYIKKYYSHIKDVHFLPLGAMSMADKLPTYIDRTIDLLFTGTYTDPNNVLAVINECDSSLQDEISAILPQMLANSKLTQEEALSQHINDLNGNISNEDFAKLMNRHFLVDTYINAYHRDRIIQTLLANNIDIDVYGSGWDKFDSVSKEHLHIHTPLSFSVALHIMSNARIVLNVMPGFKAGCHDRIFSSMLNKAVSLSDSSNYIDNIFINNDGPDKNIALYSLDALDELPFIVNKLLHNQERSSQIAQNGYDLVSKNYTWENQIHEFLKFL